MIIIGLHNPHEDCDALDPKRGTAGARLWQMSGLPIDYYMKIRRVNLVVNGSDPHVSAAALERWLKGSYADVMLLGCEVWQSFFEEKIAAFKFVERETVRFYYVPHPSGRNRYYNNKRSQTRLRALFAELTSKRVEGIEAPAGTKRVGSTKATVTGERVVEG